MIWQLLVCSGSIATNGLHIGAVGDLENKTSYYRYTSLEAECLIN